MSEKDPDCGRGVAHGGDGRGDGRGEGARQHPPTWIGWAARIFSLLAIGMILGLLVREVMQPVREVALRVEPQWDAVRTNGDGVLVPVAITNEGSRALRQLEVELDGGLGEPVAVEIDLMGEAETVTHVVSFAARPARIDHRITRYQAP